MLSSTHRASAQRKKKKLLAHATVSDGSAPYGKELISNQSKTFYDNYSATLVGILFALIVILINEYLHLF